MPLFDNSYNPSLSPYYSNFETSPMGREYLKTKEYWDKQKKNRDITKGVLHGVGSAVLSVFGMGGVAQGIGQIWEAGGAAGDKEIAKKEQDAYRKAYQHFQAQLPQGTTGVGMSESPLSSMGGYWNAKNSEAMASILKGIKDKYDEQNQLNQITPYDQGDMKQGSAFTYSPNISSTPETPQTTNYSIAPTDTAMENPTAPATGDAASSQEISISPTGGGMMGMKEGGMIKYSGGGFLKPMGEDDIALVDTKNGEDTGVRVQSGEMLVVSREKLNSLKSALKKGDHKKVYNLMKEQVAEAPKVEDGKKGFVKGGIGATDGDGNEIVLEEDFTMPKTYEGLKERFDYLQNVLGKGGFGGMFKGKNIKGVSAKDYDKVVSKLESEYERLAPIIAKSYKEKGVGELPSDYLSKFTYSQGKSKIEDGASIDLPETYTSHPSDYIGSKAVYKDGKWQMKKKGESGYVDLPKDYQEQFNELYQLPKSKGVKYGAGLEDVVITPKKDKETPPTEEVKTDVTATETPSGEEVVKRETQYPIENVPTKGADEITPTLTKYPETSIDGTYTEPKNADWQKYARFYAPQIAGNIFDIYRASTGMAAANTPLPQFQKGSAWTDYVNRMNQLSEGGFTGKEMSAAQRDIDAAYAYDVANVRNLSGGQSGLALGNLGRAAGSHYKALANLAALDDEARMRNLSAYGSVLGQDVNLNRMIFGDRYNQALWTKEAGAQLANDAIRNIKERSDYVGSYAPNSYYDQLMQMQLKEKEGENAKAKALAKYYSQYGSNTPNVGSLSNSQPSFEDYKAYKDWLKTQ